MRRRPLREIHFEKRNSPTPLLKLVSWEASDKITGQSVKCKYLLIRAKRSTFILLPKFSQQFTPLGDLMSSSVNTQKNSYRNTEASCRVSGDSQQKHILWVTIWQLFVTAFSSILLNDNLIWNLFFFSFLETIVKITMLSWTLNNFKKLAHEGLPYP